MAEGQKSKRILHAPLAPLSSLPDSWTMTFAKKLYLIAVGAIIVLSAGNASAQLPMPGIDLMKESSRPLDPEEQEKRKAIDDAYKSTMEKLPDQKKSDDPWGNIRSTTKRSPKQQ